MCADCMQSLAHLPTPRAQVLSEERLGSFLLRWGLLSLFFNPDMALACFLAALVLFQARESNAPLAR